MRRRAQLTETRAYPSVWERLLIAVTVLLGLNYIIWRWLVSVNWTSWWIALPLVVAETYSVIDSQLFGMTMWRMLRRDPPPPPPDDAIVDVFITTYDEPIEMVLATAQAALNIRYPHATWILDDGDRFELAAAAADLGVGYIARSAHWTADKPRHAKAGNLNNALFETTGEFILMLDADQVPDRAILDKTLGYFRDPQMALVQTPQYFYNVPSSDPLGSQAPLFYGPIQQGKDGWNAAYFCGSNAVLRREALMLLGVRGYVRAIEEGIKRTLNAADKILATAARTVDAQQPDVRAALDAVSEAVRDARRGLRAKEPLADVTFTFQQRVDAAARIVVDGDIATMRADLETIAALNASPGGTAIEVVFDDEALASLAGREWSPLGAIESIRAMVRAVDVDRAEEAQPMLPIATNSVTEDMSTCMRLHSMGWRSAYHHETLCRGLAPDDAATMLTQRLRWAQGTIQVMLRENPFVQKGLSLGQKFMYWATMYSYLAGFAAIAYIAGPVLYLMFGVMPVQAYSGDFYGRLVPFLLFNQLMFLVIGRGTRTWRGQQYSLALFPVWIRACVTAFRNVYFGRPLGFAVTPKTRQAIGSTPWHLVRWQLAAMVLLVVASLIGAAKLYLGAISVVGFGWNLVWVVLDLVMLGVVIQAVRYRGYRTEGE